MSDENPYSAPDSELVEQQDEDFEVHEPRSLPASDGTQWLVEGFNHFKQDAGTWIGMMVVGFIIMFVLNIIPLVNILAGFTTYVWMGGLMLGCKAQHDGQPLKIEHLFAGFTNSFLNLLGVGVVSTILMYLILFLTLSGQAVSMMAGTLNPEQIPDFRGFALGLAVAMALFIPIMMMVWFAPALIVINKVPMLTAMKMSFQGCLKNILPFLIYGILAFVMMIVASIPLGLGLLVAVPVLYASVFRSYMRIYIEKTL